MKTDNSKAILLLIAIVVAFFVVRATIRTAGENDANAVGRILVAQYGYQKVTISHQPYTPLGSGVCPGEAKAFEFSAADKTGKPVAGVACYSPNFQTLVVYGSEE